MVLASGSRHQEDFVSYSASSDSVHVTYTDWKSPQVGSASNIPPYSLGRRDRFVHVSKTLLNEETDIPATHRELDIPRFDPLIKTNYYAGDGYWISTNNKAVSWYKNAVFINGVCSQVIFDSRTNPNYIVCACLPNANKLVFIEYDSHALEFYVHQCNVSDNAVISDSSTLFSTDNKQAQLFFKSDCLTLATLGYTDDKIQLSKFVFESDYSSSTKTVIYEVKGIHYVATSELIFETEGVSGFGEVNQSINDFYPLKLFAHKNKITVLGYSEYTTNRTMDYVNTAEDDGDTDYVMSGNDASNYTITIAIRELLDNTLGDILNSVNSTSDTTLTYSGAAVSGIIEYSLSSTVYTENISAEWGNCDNNSIIYTNRIDDLSTTRTISGATILGSLTGNNSYSLELKKGITTSSIYNHLSDYEINDDGWIDEGQMPEVSTITPADYYEDFSGYSHSTTYQPNNFAFDGKLFALAFNTLITNSDGSQTAESKTLLININSLEQQLIDYRVDRDGSKFHPISVTNKPRT